MKTEEQIRERIHDREEEMAKIWEHVVAKYDERDSDAILDAATRMNYMQCVVFTLKWVLDEAEEPL